MPSRRQFVASVGAAGLAATVGCLGSSDPNYAGDGESNTKWWPQPRFDDLGSCYNPKPVGPSESVQERWSLDISAPSACAPVVADGLAFLPTASAVRAVDANTGEERWRENGGDPPMWPRSVVHHDGTLFVAWMGAPGLLALDAKTGERRWTLSPKGFGAQALLVDPRRPALFAGDDEGYVYGLDPTTGETRWRRRVFGGVTAFARSIPELLVATEAGEVFGLDSTDGRAYWRRRLHGQIQALATGDSHGAFVSVFGGPTVELSGERNGATAWRADVWTTDSFAVTAGTLFAVGDRLVSLNTNSGERRWTGGETTQCGPAAAGETVYAASDDRVIAYEFGGGLGVGRFRAGAKRWSHPVEGRPEQGLAVADGAVFVLTEGGGDESSKAYALEEA
ncbi:MULTISPECIES: PQQ-binding-like beta-propeller repeat protein [Halorussus]|uniref:PQQ-binding-like beta-propeller repeat protein n=1 Tax=Halorussus TaxID=1070314 RepID=UPI0020A16110|nr:PQQ-binding-like beta-propeller repeat protein [Halorussus vallis]USZ76096.1 PQQ-like beta-propeller repeat protein [Halorussus vallis]